MGFAYQLVMVKCVVPVLTYLVLLLLAVESSTANANICQGLFSTTFSQQSNPLGGIYASQVREIISAHPISELSKKLSGGKGLRTANYEINTILQRGKGVSGELIQGRFLKKLLDIIFPEVTYISTGAMGINDGVSLNIFDYAEKGEASKNDMVNMPLLKSARPSISVKGRREKIRSILNVQDTEPVVHIYNRVPVSREIFSGVDMIADLMASKERPKIIFLSWTSKFIFFDMPKYINPAWYRVINYTQVLRNGLPAFTGTYIILNNTEGRMEEIYEACDVAIVGGPINFFEPLNLGIPTVHYTDANYLRKYHAPTLSMMSKIAQRTGGYLRVDDPSDFEGSYRAALKLQSEDIIPSFLTKDSNGKTPLDHLLDNILENLTRQLN